LAKAISLRAMTHHIETKFLRRPDGRIAYDVRGSGPLVVCVPGMGDLRSAYRHLAPALAEAGFRVATMDLRGHGDSDATFTDYDDVAAGSDALALIEELGGGTAVLVGNSMGAGVAVWAAAEQPEAVVGLALLGPFVREIPIGAAQRAALALALRRPWGPTVWAAYWTRLFPGRPPGDLAEQRARVKASVKANWAAFKATTRTSHAPAEARLGQLRIPTLVVMGERDPDFPDPVAEARTVAELTGGQVLTVPDAGHYPQAEYPEVVSPAMIELCRRAFAKTTP
jgi:pimeloyl-ACP methyl ester carboxylesterase